MEKKNMSENKSIRSEKKFNLEEAKILKSKSQDIKSVKNEIKIQNQISNSNDVVKTKKKEKPVKSDNQVLKRKVTEDGVSVERILSEGEASSDFETISSLDSNYGTEDLDLISSINEDDFNVIVEIENELDFQNSRKSVAKVCYGKDRFNNLYRYQSRSGHFLGDYKRRRSDSFTNVREPRFRQNNKYIDMNYKNDKRYKGCNERKEFSHFGCDSPISCDRNRSRNRGRNRSKSRSRSRNRSRSRSRSWSWSWSWSRNHRRFRQSRIYGSRSRYSRSSECSDRSQSSRSLESTARSKSSSYKHRKTKARRSESFDKNPAKSYPERNSTSRKRTRSHSSCIWDPLSDNCLSPDRIRKKLSSSKEAVKNSRDHLFRKKERTPFLVELERKLKEAECSTNLIEEVTNKSLASVPEHSLYLTMPMFSLENLPLVPGPSGLPVHITITGEQILHDMDGRRIPIGPNGFYLPVDPTGRLFPHIISPTNEAVPIHLTEDGILRLPNSEPVPYGPGHQLPVNIDGNVILISPDSRPLHPCFNLPKKPPPLMQMMDSSGAGQMAFQQAVPVAFHMPQLENQPNFVKEPQETQNISQVNIQSSKTDLTLLECLHNYSEKINKTDLMEKYKKKVQERIKDSLKCIEMGKNSFMRGEVKKSTPVKLLEKKTFRCDNCNCSSDIILDSGDSDSASSLKCISELNKGATEEIVLSSDDDQDHLKVVYDSKIQQVQINKGNGEDPITKKVLRAIRSLCEKDYKPPAFGRFIITNVMSEPFIKKSPNESPLIKNRIQLPFLTPKTKNVPLKDQLSIEEKTAVTFKFLPQVKLFEKKEKLLNFRQKIGNKNCDSSKFPVFTLDFAMQCDFTSVIIKNLNSKVSELEMEVVRLKNVNSDLLDGYKNVQAMNQQKNDQLKKAVLEIEEKDNEILTLKRSLEKRQ